MKQFILMPLFALVATFSFGQTTTTKETQKTPCEATELSYAVQIASTIDPIYFTMQPAYAEVLDTFETEKVCTKNGKEVYRILIPAEDWVTATHIEAYYKTTKHYKDAFVVTYRNGVRLN